jgi:hypothetical protein
MNFFVFGRMIERPPANKGNQPIMSDRTSLCAAMLELLVERYVPSVPSRSSRLPHWLFLSEVDLAAFCKHGTNDGTSLFVVLLKLLAQRYDSHVLPHYC